MTENRQSSSRLHNIKTYLKLSPYQHIIPIFGSVGLLSTIKIAELNSNPNFPENFIVGGGLMVFAMTTLLGQIEAIERFKSYNKLKSIFRKRKWNQKIFRFMPFGYVTTPCGSRLIQMAAQDEGLGDEARKYIRQELRNRHNTLQSSKDISY